MFSETEDNVFYPSRSDVNESLSAFKCRTHPEVAERLLATENVKLVENSQCDYFWSCGRDRRGHNT